MDAYTQQYGSLDPSENTESGYDDDYDEGDYDDHVDGDPFIELGAALDLIADLIRKQERPFIGAKERKIRVYHQMREVNNKRPRPQGFWKEIRRSSQKLKKEVVQRSKVRSKRK